MSKLLKYTKGFDNNPNSDIGASKRVVKEYKKLLAKEQLKPIIQEMNNQTKSVVTNLNDYSLLLKSITQNLVNADLYLTNPEVSKSKGAGRYTGGGLTEKERKKILNAASKKGITTKAQALKHIQDSYRDKPAETKITVGDKNIIKAFNLANIKATTNAKKVIEKVNENNKVVIPEENEKDDFVDDIPEEEAEEYLFDHNSPKSPKNIINIDQIMEGDRYALQPMSGNIHGGEPDLNDYESEGEEEEDDDEEEATKDDDDTDVSFHPSFLDEMSDFSSNHSLGPYEGDGGDDNEEDEVSNLGDLINKRENTPIRENFIITLFSNIINQVHKASDFWETNITPNLSDIPKLKMDSFIKSNAVKNFEDAITRFEDTLISGTIKTHLNYLDNIYHNLTRSLDELFERMNIDIKRYAGGMSSSSSDKPQLLGSGYLPFRSSIYGSHLRDSNTKYLM
jgi:hypothetical protein